MRQDMVKRAVVFLRHPKVKDAPREKQVAFLKDKSLTTEVRPQQLLLYYLCMIVLVLKTWHAYCTLLVQYKYRVVGTLGPKTTCSQTGKLPAALQLHSTAVCAACNVSSLSMLQL